MSESFESLEFVGFPKYKISSLGEIYNITRNRKIKQKQIRHSMQVQLSKDKKTKVFFVHVLVARAFYGTPKNRVISHKNGNRKDNRAENLKWVTKEEKRKISQPRCKIGIPILQMDDNFNIIKIWGTTTEAAETLKYPKPSLFRACRTGKKYRSFYWKKDDQILENEEFQLAPFVEYEPVYVSKFGRVKKPDGIAYRGFLNLGYYFISLFSQSKNKFKSVQVHRLIIATFSERNDKKHINHRNGIKNDNRFENLEYASASENAFHAHRTGLCEDCGVKVDQLDLEGNFIKRFKSMRQAEKDLKINHRIISAACSGKRKDPIVGGYIWKYSKKTDEQEEIEQNSEELENNEKKDYESEEEQEDFEEENE